MLNPLPALFLPYPDDLVVLLPLEVWKDEIFWSEKEFFSPTIKHLLPFLLGVLVVVQVGLGWGLASQHFSLQPRRLNTKFPKQNDTENQETIIYAVSPMSYPYPMPES
jgi:hypothetical protein